MTLYPFTYSYGNMVSGKWRRWRWISNQYSAGRGNIGWKRRRSRRLLSWIKTSSKIHNRRIPVIKTITNCWCGKNRFCMKSKRQKSAIKAFRGSIFHSQIRAETAHENRHRQTWHDILSLENRIFMCEQDYENTKLTIQNFHFFANVSSQIFVLVRTEP